MEEKELNKLINSILPYVYDKYENKVELILRRTLN